MSTFKSAISFGRGKNKNSPSKGAGGSTSYESPKSKSPSAFGKAVGRNLKGGQPKQGAVDISRSNAGLDDPVPEEPVDGVDSPLSVISETSPAPAASTETTALPDGFPPASAEVAAPVAAPAAAPDTTDEFHETGPLAAGLNEATPADAQSAVSTEDQLAREEDNTLKELRFKMEQARMSEEDAARAKAVEEAKLAAAAKQKAALEARMAAMTEEELLNMQMTEKLTTDLETCRGSLTLATESLSATETEIAMIQDGLKEERTAEINKIATLEVVVKSFSGMLAAVETYDEQCTQLKTEVAQLVTMENQRRMDTHGISGRIKQELDEAQARLKKQTDLMHNMHRDLKKMYTEYHTAEKQQETQLAVVSSEVAAKKLNLDLAQQRLALLRSEMSKLQERIEDTRFIEAKKQRVATTTAQVEEIKGKMALDDQAIVACKKRETQIVEEEQLSEAKMEARLRAYDADKDSLRSLVALQEAFLNGELAALENEEDSSDPTKAKLLESTRVLVQERATASKNRMDEIEQAERTYTADYNAAHDRRQAQLRQKRAERKALEAAHSERQRYLNEKMSQLEIEEKQLAAAARTIQDHKDCIKMLQAEMELSQTATNERQSELTTAMNLKKAFTTQLESLKTANKLNLARLRVQIDSESRVHSEQQSYVESLMGRMKLESTAVVEEDGTESEDAAAAAPPQGKHGLALAHQNEAAMTAWVEELNAQRTEAESSLVGARTALVTAEKRAQNMLAAAEEQRITQQHEVSKLQQYELSLETKLATVSPRASPATPSKVQFHLPNNALGAISEATPYKGSVKLLHTSEKFAQPHSPTTVDPIASGFGLTEEEDHPMYNPDLKPDIEATSEKRTSIRSRISGYVPAIGQRLIFADASEYP